MESRSGESRIIPRRPCPPRWIMMGDSPRDAPILITPIPCRTKTSARPRSSITGRRPPGKIAVTPTKQLTNQRDLALAYTPGVAAACDEIVRDPREARNLTARGNLVGVVTNGTAVLGLGAIGPLAAKPVMEGKAVLFKKFAGIDCFDIEINERDPDKLVDIIVALEPTFGGINLEDIKAPECFYDRAQVPRAHEDPGVPRRPARHRDHRRRGGAERAARRRQGHRARSSSCARARAPRRSRASTCCVALGVRRENIWVADIEGVVYEGRNEEMDEQQGALRAEDEGAHARRHPAGRRRLPRPVRGARAEARMAREDGADAAHPRARQSRARDHAGRREGGAARRDHRHRPLGLSRTRSTTSSASRSSSAARSTSAPRTINEEMKLAAVRAIADLAMAEQSDIVAHAYGIENLTLRSRVPDPEAVRSAPDREDRAGGGEGGDGHRRRDAADRRLRRVSRSSCTQFVYHSGPADEADLRGGEEGAEAHRLRRRRGRARAARRAGGRRRRARASRSSSAGRR